MSPMKSDNDVAFCLIIYHLSVDLCQFINPPPNKQANYVDVLPDNWSYLKPDKEQCQQNHHTNCCKNRIED